MPDGSAQALGMVGRALSLEGWRAVRRQLPADFRRALPINPPKPRGVALALLGDILRKRARRRADEDEPKWRPRISDIATAYGVDRSTIEDWLHGASFARERGCVVIRGLTALRMARQMFTSAPPATMEEAIVRLDADLQRRVSQPREWRSTAGESDLMREVEAPRYPELGTGAVSIAQLAALISTPDARSFKLLAEAGRTVRDVLREMELRYGKIDPEWLRTGMGQAFWWSLVETIEKKYREKEARASRSRE